jgi:DeoR family transcriptional regulator, fructose operon transcriptional repressor
MQAEERQLRISQYMQKVEFASLEELAKFVGASVSSVRRDVSILEAKGIIRRTHGGARLIAQPRSDEFIFAARDTRQAAEKEAIGKACAGLVKPSSSLILDAGSTVYHVARHLEPKQPQIITNSLPVANFFSSSSQVETVVTGGVIYPRLCVLVGPLAVKAFHGLNADLAVMSSSGITTEGITNSHALLIDIQLAMIKAAEKVIFCLDHTKFGRRSMAFLCDLSEIDIIVTDSHTPAGMVTAIRRAGPKVVIAD